VRVDDCVLRVLTAINSGDDLGKLALRGARYGLPAWVTEQEGTRRQDQARLPRGP
jgi:hypothetical protein